MERAWRWRGSATTLFSLAIAYQALGRADESAKAFQRARELDPTLGATPGPE